MGIVECYFGLQHFNNLHNLQFCIKLSLYQLLSSIYPPSKLYQLVSAPCVRSTLYPLRSTNYSLHSVLYDLHVPSTL